MAAGDITSAGLALVRHWDGAVLEVENRERELERARTVLANARTALVKWLVPQTAKVGDVYCVPIGDVFVEVVIGSTRLIAVGDGPDSFEVKPEVRWRSGHRPNKDWQFLGTPR